MSFKKYFLRLFAKRTEKNKNVPIDQACPVCWGYREYGSSTRLMGKEKRIDVKNHRDKYVKVGKFMVEHVDGFKNETKVVARCPSCGGKKIIYK